MDNKIHDYFDSIEPSEELIERTVIMAQNNNKRIKLSKGMVAALVAAVVLVIGITGYAAASHIFGNNEKGIVSENSDEGVQFNLDFTKADTIPDEYSNTDNDIVKKFNSAGYKDVLLPDALIGPNFTVGNINYKKGTLAMISFDDGQGHVFDVFIIPEIAKEDMKDAIALGGNEGVEINECYVKTYNGIDVQLTYFGGEEIGYSSRITYAAGNTVYMIQPPNGNTLDEIKNRTEELAKTLETQH